MNRRNFLKLAIVAAVAPIIPTTQKIEPKEVAAHIYVPPELEETARKIISNPLTSREFTDRLDAQMRKVYYAQYMDIRNGNLRNT